MRSMGSFLLLEEGRISRVERDGQVVRRKD
jgi:hypothetical protein